ncbi:2-methylisocitrate lyase-like PEP mutase family enzyme [Bradyrhizobium japonicum]|jgi:phosphoenolpyruvate phosphomutase
MRAAVSAMRQLCDRLFAEENATTIEPNIADLEEVFDMLQYDELARAEKRYLQPNKR